MTDELRGMRAVLTQDKNVFGNLLSTVLSPSQPLQSPQYLKGRDQNLYGIEKALFQPGRHVLIHGLRGVGKSSLAQTAAFKLSKKIDPILIGCDQNSTFHTVVREIFDEAEQRNPRLISEIKEKGIGFASYGISAHGKRSITEGNIDDPSSLNEAVRLLAFLSEKLETRLVVVVDEFDQVTDSHQQALFTNLVKQISDKRVDACFIFCGIGESPAQIMEAHGSADRYFHTVELGPLTWGAREEIMKDAAKQLGVVMDRDTLLRIAKISDGFPHYVHFLSEKLFWRVYEASNEGAVTPGLFELAMSDASSSMDLRLKGPYDKAIQKYHGDYEPILWALADGHEFVRRSRAVYDDSYVPLMKAIELPILPREKFNQRINRLKKPSHGEILLGNRQGWYEFTEKMIRGYVRLRAAQRGVNLGADHPRGSEGLQADAPSYGRLKASETS
ncbi:MAG: ATP-binding protein [Pseudomonadota bacterium]